MTIYTPPKIRYIDPEIDPPTDWLKIYRFSKQDYSDKTVPPLDLNYDTGLIQRLQPKETAVFGEIQVRELYETSTFDPNTGLFSYDNLIVKENHVYTRDPAGFAIARAILISWYLEDGTPHATTKTLYKAYDLAMRQEEGEKRRGHLIKLLMMEVGGMLMQTQAASQQEALQMGRDFLADYHQEKDMMVEASDQGILGSVKFDTTHTWLDDDVPGVPGYPIRRYMFDKIDLWGVGWDNVTQ